MSIYEEEPGKIIFEISILGSFRGLNTEQNDKIPNYKQYVKEFGNIHFVYLILNYGGYYYNKMNKKIIKI